MKKIFLTIITIIVMAACKKESEYVNEDIDITIENPKNKPKMIQAIFNTSYRPIKYEYYSNKEKKTIYKNRYGIDLISDEVLPGDKFYVKIQRGTTGPTNNLSMYIIAIPYKGIKIFEYNSETNDQDKQIIEIEYTFTHSDLYH